MYNFIPVVRNDFNRLHFFRILSSVTEHSCEMVLVTISMNIPGFSIHVDHVHFRDAPRLPVTNSTPAYRIPSAVGSLGNGSRTPDPELPESAEGEVASCQDDSDPSSSSSTHYFPSPAHGNFRTPNCMEKSIVSTVTQIEVPITIHGKEQEHNGTKLLLPYTVVTWFRVLGVNALPGFRRSATELGLLACVFYSTVVLFCCLLLLFIQLFILQNRQMSLVVKRYSDLRHDLFWIVEFLLEFWGDSAWIRRFFSLIFVVLPSVFNDLCKNWGNMLEYGTP